MENNEELPPDKYQPEQGTRSIDERPEEDILESGTMPATEEEKEREQKTKGSSALGKEAGYGITKPTKFTITAKISEIKIFP